MTRFLPLLLIPLLAVGTPLHATETPPDTEALNFGALRRSGFDAGVDKVVVPLESTPGGLIAVVKINGKPVRLMVDTGAESSVVSPEIANRIGLKAFESMRINSGSGSSEGHWSLTSEIRIGKAWTRFEPLTVVNMPFGPGAWFEGLLGISTLRDWDVRIDPKAKTMTLFPAGKSDRLQGEISVNMKILDNDGMKNGSSATRFRPGEIATFMLFNGKPLLARFDTGYDGVLSLSGTLAETMDTGILARAKPAFAKSFTLTGTIENKYSEASEIRFGDDTLRAVPVSLSDYPPGNESDGRSIIGLNLLRHYVMTFRFADDEVRIKPLGTVLELTKKSTAGITCDASFKISELLANGPAEKAGLKVGDQLIAIHDHPVKMLTLEQFTAFKRLPPGTPFYVRYSRAGGEPKVVTVILEKE